MRRRFTLRAEILRRLHEAGAEYFLPESIHRHSRRQWVRFVAPATAQGRGGSSEDLTALAAGRTGRPVRPFLWLIVHAAIENVRERLSIRALVLNVGDSTASGNCFALFLERTQIIDDTQEVTILAIDEVQLQSIFLLGGKRSGVLHARRVDHRPQSRESNLLLAEVRS